MQRYFTRKSQTTNLVADQQFYQLPEDCIRVTGVVVTDASIEYPVEPMASELEWRALNSNNAGTVQIPRFFFVRGKDEIGLWPAPASNVTNGLEVYYEPRERDMSQDDYTTGTVTVTNASATITHSGTGFSQNMVGRYFRTTDGSEGLWYRISAYVSTSELTLENVYEGISGSGRTFIIGEAPQIPEEYHESLLDFVAYRFYLRRRDVAVAQQFKSLFDGALDDAKQRYASKTTNKVIHRRQYYRFDSPFTRPPDNFS